MTSPPVTHTSVRLADLERRVLVLERDFATRERGRLPERAQFDEDELGQDPEDDLEED